MNDQELQAKLNDMQRQLDKLFSYQGITWKQIERQRIDNQVAQATRTPHNPTERFGEVRPKDHERK